MRVINLISSIGFLCISAHCFCQENANAEKSNSSDLEKMVVNISAIKDPEKRLYKNYLKGLEKFEANHAKAPNAELKFRIIPQKTSAETTGLGLRIVGDDISIPVDLSDDLLFSLPRDSRITSDDTELVLNAKSKTYKWRPYIRSPNIAEKQYRLGDMRLTCDVRMTIVKAESFMLRMLLAVFPDVCRLFFDNGRMSGIGIAIFDDLDFNKIVAFTLISGDKRERILLPFKDHPEQKYAEKVFWDDDTLVEIELAEKVQ